MTDGESHHAVHAGNTPRSLNTPESWYACLGLHWDLLLDVSPVVYPARAAMSRSMSAGMSPRRTCRLSS